MNSLIFFGVVMVVFVFAIVAYVTWEDKHKAKKANKKR